MEPERILLIAEYLRRCATEPPGVTVREILDHLHKRSELQDVSAVTVRRDIERIERTFGSTVVRTAGPHNTTYFRYTGASFTFNEIRFIVDSVSINKFLSNKEKNALIGKFEGLCSERDLRQLKNRISISRQAYQPEGLLENLECLHRAISEQQCICFSLRKYDGQGRPVCDSKDRRVHPIEIQYFNERFYLIAWEEQRKAPRTYRVDRMRNISFLGRVAEYREAEKRECAVVDMFGIQRIRTVQLRVRRDLLDEMHETFGEYLFSVKEPADSPDYVVIQARVGISEHFPRFLLKYGRDIELLAPQDLRDAVRQELEKMTEMYSG